MAVPGSSITGFSYMLPLMILRTRCFSRSVDVLPSVDIHRLAGDPVGAGRREEQHRSCDISGLAETRLGDGRQDRVLIRAFGDAGCTGGVDQSRADAVDGDLRSELLRQAFGQADDPGFRRGVGRLADRLRRPAAVRARDRRDVDYALLLALEHVRSEAVAPGPGAHHVALHDRIEIFRPDVEERARFGLAGDVHEYVHMTGLRKRGIRHPTNFTVTRGVAGYGVRVPPEAADLLGHGLSRGFVDVDDVDVGTGCRQGMGTGATDVPAAAGYESRPSAQVVHGMSHGCRPFVTGLEPDASTS